MFSIPALLVAALASVTAPAVLPGACLRPPVLAPVVDPFRDPCQYCPGNRGLTYAVAAGTAVRAMAAGRVTFSGVVAGNRYVVVEHADGLRATYGDLARTGLSEGDAVGAGAVVGHSSERLHVGLRRGETYLDPAPLIGRLEVRPSLVPTDGTRRRLPPPPRLVCGAAAALTIRPPRR